MGVFTEATRALRDEIVSSRRARAVFGRDLVDLTGERRTRVSALCAGFARDRAGVHRAWFGQALSECRTAEAHRQPTLGETARAENQNEERPLVAPKTQARRDEAAGRAAALAARAAVAPAPEARKPQRKGSRKH